MNCLRAAALLATAIALWPVAAQAPIFDTGTAPPPGFEDLMSAQTTLVDVIYNGQPLTSTLATFDLDTIEFATPGDIVSAIDDLVAPDQVLDALTGQLDSHAAHLCHNAAQLDCGQLHPDVAAVIFDDVAFRAEVFVHPDQRRLQRLSTERYLPDPTSNEVATVHQFNLALSDERFDLGGVSLVSRGADRLLARYESASGGVGISEALWQRDRRGVRYEAGLFQSTGRQASFVGEQRVAGVRVGTALDLRADLDIGNGTPILLFLNQRSRVDVYRGGRLIDSSFYDAGNQQLDTTRLPDGAYEITLQITGNDGRQREEAYFFVRSGALPPIGETLSYFELGSLTRGPNPLPGAQATGTWLRAGAARRLGNEWGVEGEVTHARGTSLLQAGFFGFGRHWQGRGHTMFSNDGAAGTWLQLRTRGERWSAGFDLRVLKASSQNPAAALFPESFRQGALTVNMPFRRGRLTLRGQLDQRGNESPDPGWGSAFSMPLPRRGRVILDLQSDIFVSANDRTARIAVQARWRRNRSLTTANAGWLALSRPGVSSSGPTLDVRRSTQWDHDTFGRVTGTTLARSADQQHAVGASVIADARRGRGRADVQWLSGPDGGGLSYSANARFGVTTHHGHVAVGGRAGDSAAIVVTVDGHTEDQYDVLVDDQRVAIARGGGRTLVSLPPYARYRVRLVPRGATLIDVDEAPTDVMLYPGNVSTLAFSARRVFVIVGQAVSADGMALAGATTTVQGQTVATDDQGWFQLEVGSLIPLTFTTADGTACQITLPGTATQDGLFVLPPTPCLAIPATP